MPGLAIWKKNFNVPEWNLATFSCVSTNDCAAASSIDATGENTMFDAKYNSLFDNACFRIAVNCALFVVWIGAAYGSLAVR